MTQITCERCHSAIDAEDVNIAIGVARCRSCGGVFDLGHRTAAASGAPTPAPRASVPLPSKFAVDAHGGEVLIRWRWFGPQYLFMLFFCVAWDGFLVAWYGKALTAANISATMTLFPIAHVAAGVALTYSTLAGLLNRTWIRADRHGLSVRHTPIPWLGNRDFVRSDLKQLYSTQRSDRSRNGRILYQLNAVTRDGRSLPIVKNLESAEQALYLEQRLEKCLDIVDQPVPGELPRMERLGMG
jgi:hypothetical protein